MSDRLFLASLNWCSGGNLVGFKIISDFVNNFQPWEVLINPSKKFSRGLCFLVLELPMVKNWLQKQIKLQTNQSYYSFGQYQKNKTISLLLLFQKNNLAEVTDL